MKVDQFPMMNSFSFCLTLRKSMWCQVFIYFLLFVSLSSCKDKNQQTWNNLIRNVLPIEEAESIEMIAAAEVLSHHLPHVVEKRSVCVFIPYGASEKQIKFLRQIFPATFTYETCKNDTSVDDDGHVIVSVRGLKEEGSDSVVVEWSYLCGSACGYSGKFSLRKYDDKWIIVKHYGQKVSLRSPYPKSLQDGNSKTTSIDLTCRNTFQMSIISKNSAGYIDRYDQNSKTYTAFISSDAAAMPACGSKSREVMQS